MKSNLVLPPALALLMGCTSAPPGGGPEVPPAGAPRKIPVTRSWGDLLAQPPIDLGGGLRVRLGLESDRCPRWSGVLLYCLAEGYAPPERYDTDGKRLGPLIVNVRHPDGLLRVEPGGKFRFARASRDPEELRRMRSLYVLPVGVRQPGTYRIILHSESVIEVAAADLEGADEPFHSFSPLEQDDQPGELERRSPTEEEPFAVARVTYRGKGIALPDRDGMRPVILEDREPDSPLPVLVPREPDPALKLEVEGTALTVASEEDILTSHPVQHFLARWWVNEKPYVPGNAGGFVYRNGLVNEGRRLKLRLRLDPASLGARSGDRIGVQLLYCEEGWTLFGDIIEKLAASRGAAPASVRLSNRVEFTAP